VADEGRTQVATVISPLRRAERVAADADAIACGRLRLTYAQTGERCRRLGGALAALGLMRGDRVAVIGPNCHRYLELYQGVPGAGMVIVPLNARHTAGELRYALQDAGARVLFSGIEVPDLPDCVEHVFDLGDRYEALLESATPRAFVESDENDVAGLFYTGGTTGRSKGVMLTHRNLLANAVHFQWVWPFEPATRWLVAAPLFHAAGSVAVLATVWQGGLQIPLPVFHPATALDLMAEHDATHTLLVPSMLAALTDEQFARPRRLASLRGISHGGSPIATETLRRAHAAFPHIELLHLYGATETAPIVTGLRHEERLLDDPCIRSCGQPVPGVEVRLCDPDGAPAAFGEIGEVLVRGPNVMRGYWNQPAQTADVLSDGWYRTGDLGYLDAQDHLYLVDRAKDMIVTGGENVYGTEVEEALYAHDAVQEAAVFGVPDERWGEAVYAVVVPRTAVDPNALIAHCRTLIAGYKVPKHIELRAEPLPKSAAGKVLKRQLRAPHWEGRTEAIAGA
jgi:long-chain acyl-CoA synthetase